MKEEESIHLKDRFRHLKGSIHDMRNLDITGIILAGGKSTRMGTNKAFLGLRGKRLIEHTVAIFQDIFQEVIIVANDLSAYEYLNVRVVKDVVEIQGSIVGIFSGLLSATYHYSFVVACDMPLLNKDIILHLSSHAKIHDMVIPFCLGRYQPLHAIYSKNCLKPLNNLISCRDLKIINLFNKVKTKVIEEKDLRQFDSELTSFLNINTKEEFLKLSQLSGSECS